MEIRRAGHQDTARLINYLEAYHKESNLSDIPFDRKSMSKIIDYFLSHRDSIIFIAEELGQVKGALLGTVEPFFFNQKHTYATDLLFIADGGGVGLWRYFKRWADSKGVSRIMMGISSGDARACQLLESLGMENTGGMYVLRR